MKEYGTLDLSFLLRPARWGEPEAVALGVALAVLAGGAMLGREILPTIAIAAACGLLERVIWYAICNIYARRASNGEVRRTRAADLG